MPTVTLPKLMMVGLAASEPDVTAVPVTAILRLEFAAVDASVMPPLTVPAELGANATWKTELWPGPRVRGNVSPLTVRPAPTTPAWVMVALVPPELLKVTGWLCVLPTVTFPKLMLAGFAPSCPAVVPSPATEKVTLAGLLDCGPEEPLTLLMVKDELPLTLMLAFALPVEVGANVTLKAAL